MYSSLPKLLLDFGGVASTKEVSLNPMRMVLSASLVGDPLGEVYPFVEVLPRPGISIYDSSEYNTNLAICTSTLREWNIVGRPVEPHGPECLRGGTFEGKNPSPEEANTRVRLLILYSVPIVNK